MLPLLFSINWNPDRTFFTLGSLPIHYYSLCWVIGIALSTFMVHRQYRDRRISEATFEPLFFYCFFGILIGSRLGHCLFYQPEYYLSSLSHFVEMILPIKFLPGGDWKFTGYEGLASHGGTLGLIIALWLYCRKTKMHYMDVLDMIAVATPICACFIRLGNLMNSEIIGKPSDAPWAFVFQQVDNVPRHPAQLYEAIAYFVFFLLMVYLYKRGQRRQQTTVQTDFSASHAAARTSHHSHKSAELPSYYPRGFFFGLCLTEIFAFRFFIEFLKENQVDFENSMSLNMGQWLSIPFVLVGLYCMFLYGKKAKN